MQAVHSLANFGNPSMTGIGLMVWLSPIPAMMLAYQFAMNNGPVGVRRWFAIYVVGVLAFSFTIYLQFTGVAAAAFGEVGEGIQISSFGDTLVANSGLFRSSEIAAWHASAAACFVTILVIHERLNPERLLTVLGLIVFLVTMGLLTGRRKMLVEVALFLALFFFLRSWYASHGWRQIVGLGMAVAAILLTLTMESGNDAQDAGKIAAWRYEITGAGRYDDYALRGTTAFEDIPKRVEELGIAPISWALESLGWFGSGLGTGSQSTGGDLDSRRNIGAAEGGLGSIMVELGMPGLLLMIWLGHALMKFTDRTLKVTSDLSLAHSRIAYGIVAFLCARKSPLSLLPRRLSAIRSCCWSWGFVSDFCTPCLIWLGRRIVLLATREVRIHRVRPTGALSDGRGFVRSDPRVPLTDNSHRAFPRLRCLCALNHSGFLLLAVGRVDSGPGSDQSISRQPHVHPRNQRLPR